jgi:AcrR family transcriptional regulator
MAATARDQRRRIVAATRMVVAEHGFAATTITHIVVGASVARGAFYEQFKDKQACFAAVHEDCQERLLAAFTLPCYSKRDFPKRVRASLLSGLEFLAGEPSLAHLISIEAPAAGLGVAKSYLAWMDRYAELLRLGPLGTPDPDGSPAFMEAEIVAAVAGSVARTVIRGDAKLLADLAPDLAEFVLAFYEREHYARSL